MPLLPLPAHEHLPGPPALPSLKPRRSLRTHIPAGPWRRLLQPCQDAGGDCSAIYFPSGSLVPSPRPPPLPPPPHLTPQSREGGFTPINTPTATTVPQVEFTAYFTTFTLDTWTEAAQAPYKQQIQAAIKSGELGLL